MHWEQPRVASERESVRRSREGGGGGGGPAQHTKSSGGE